MSDRPRLSAFDHALRLLAQRPHFRNELARKLARKGHSPDDVADALERSATLGYLDDAALAAAEAERLAQRKGLGRAGVAAELRRKGADPSAVGAALADSSPEEERARARAAAERWLRTHRGEPAALARHLERKGYASSIVYAVVGALVPGSEPGDPEA